MGRRRTIAFSTIAFVLFALALVNCINGVLGLHGYLIKLVAPSGVPTGRRNSTDALPPVHNAAAAAAAARTRNDRVGSASSNVWVSLSLCVDDNSHELRQKGVPFKQQYPYEEAMVAGIQLWTSVAGAKVIVTLVGSDDANTKRRLEEVEIRSRTSGADAMRVISPFDAELGCVLESQLQRMYACQHPAILDEDVVITSDVDSFPTSDIVLSPLKNRTYDTWIYQWGYSERLGLTFPLSFIAMRSSLWKSITSKLWGEIARKSAITGRRGWGVDQLLVSRRILQLKLCSCNNENFWRGVSLAYQPFSDQGCFHGNVRNNNAGGWIWVHLTPGHNATDILEIKGLIMERKEQNMEYEAFVERMRTLYERNEKIHLQQSQKPRIQQSQKPVIRTLNLRHLQNRTFHVAKTPG